MAAKFLLRKIFQKTKGKKKIQIYLNFKLLKISFCLAVHRKHVNLKQNNIVKTSSIHGASTKMSSS